VIQFLPQDLGKWDDLASPEEALVLTLFSDERPLRGAASACDWRLCGRLSRLLKSGRLHGESGEVMLYPPGPRLPFQRLVLFGLGPSGSFDLLSAQQSTRRILDVVAQMGLKRFGIVLPGRSMGKVGARQAAEVLLKVPHPELEPLVVESAAGQKEAAQVGRT
jgi:hypothetical protein